MVLRGYFDDSADDKRQRFSAVGGLVGTLPTSFHLWSRESLDYLKAKGGPDNLEALTTWGQRGETVPQMKRWFRESFKIK
jgi:hypothetical protein